MLARLKRNRNIQQNFIKRQKEPTFTVAFSSRQKKVAYDFSYNINAVQLLQYFSVRSTLAGPNSNSSKLKLLVRISCA